MSSPPDSSWTMASLGRRKAAGISESEEYCHEPLGLRKAKQGEKTAEKLIQKDELSGPDL